MYQPFGKKRLKSRTRRARRGPLTRNEKSLVAALVDQNGELTPNQIEATAIALRRKPETVADAIVSAREKLQRQAEFYVEAHAEAVQKALIGQAFDTARRGAEWAIDRISVRTSEGTIERIIDRDAPSDSQLMIRIGLALGGMSRPPKPRTGNDSHE
jgi:hypothetical protein